MLPLLITLVSIGLAALLMYGGITVMQTVSPARAQAKENTITAFHGLAAAYQAYINANGASPTVGACSATQLVPNYISEIKMPVTGMSCSFGTDATYGDYFCYYSTSVPQAAYNGFQDACNVTTTNCSTSQSFFPSGSYVISTSACGARANSTTPSSWPAAAYLTYWLKGA